MHDSEKQVMQSRQDSVQFKLRSGTLYVESHTLEKMKATMQSFMDGSDFPAQFLEIREPMRAELKSSAVWIHEGQAGIGIWKLENHDGHLALVRYPPPRKGTTLLYRATLEQRDSGWKVVSFEQERESGPA